MITNSRISWGDSLGAQLSTVASLLYIGKETNQQVVLWEELSNLRRGYQFFDVFEIDGINLVSRTSKVQCKLIKMMSGKYSRINTWQKQMKRIYNNKIRYYYDRVLYEYVKCKYKDFNTISPGAGGVHANPALLTLEMNKNYDIWNGFGTFQDWKKYYDEIIEAICFKKEIQETGTNIYNGLNTKYKNRVGIHFRRADYLVLSSLCLGDEYYKQSMDMFDICTSFLVFSDDIEEVKSLGLFENKDVTYVSTGSSALDLFLMTKCNSLIIANSSFSFWGAILNTNKDKVVICPHDYIGGNCLDYTYMNGNWYPEDWIAINNSK